MMLAGLLNIHLQGGDKLGLGRFLWKQVSGDTFPFLPFVDVVPLNRGSFGFYLLLLLRSRQRSAFYLSLYASLFLLISIRVAGVHYFEPEW
jgi:hypothetical protein